MPQLVLSLFHASVRGIHLVKVDRLKDLERAPAMVHENLIVQVCSIIAVHSETTRLSEGVDDSGMSVEVATPLHATVTESTGRFESFAVEHDLVDGSVVVMEAGEWPDRAIHHWTVEPGCGLAGDSITQSLHLCFHISSGFLECLLQTVVFETDNAAGVFLKLLLTLCSS